MYRLNNYAEVQCPAEQGGRYKTPLEGKCPTCRKPISKSKRRMLGEHCEHLRQSVCEVYGFRGEACGERASPKITAEGQQFRT